MNYGCSEWYKCLLAHYLHTVGLCNLQPLGILCWQLWSKFIYNQASKHVALGFAMRVAWLPAMCMHGTACGLWLSVAVSGLQQQLASAEAGLVCPNAFSMATGMSTGEREAT